jgi:recombination protein RecR
MNADPISRLVAELAKLPGIGEKSAQRLAFFILKSPKEYAASLSSAINEVVQKVHLCSRCCTLTERDPCATCSDPRRDPKVLCVVESVPDQLAIERTREFRGQYHVLHGSLSPLEGIGPDQLRIKELMQRLQSSEAQEVIVATNPDVEGEATALYLLRLLKPMGLKLTRIAQGVPMGGDLEYADPVTLARALSGRREL